MNRHYKPKIGSGCIQGVLVIVGFLIIVGGCLAQPYFEAKSFNKLTGGNATYWDAVWSNLRVDGSSQRRNDE